jgi:DNA-binding Xre family transcriptional regulator
MMSHKQKIQRLLKERRWKGGDLVRATGIPRETLGRLIRGEVPVAVPRAMARRRP